MSELSFETWLDGVVIETLKTAFANCRSVMLERLDRHVWQHPSRPQVDSASPKRGTHAFRFFLETPPQKQRDLLAESVARLEFLYVSVYEALVIEDGAPMSTKFLTPTTLLDELAKA